MDNIEIDMEKTKNFYKNYKDFCTCLYCEFYYSNIKKYYPNLCKFLEKINVDPVKPFELSLPYLDDLGNLVFPFAQYLVIGKADYEFTYYIENLSIKIASSYPKVNLSSDYFVLEIANVIFDNKSLNRELIEDLID